MRDELCEQHQAALRECARLLAAVGMETARVTDNQVLFNILRSCLAVPSDTSGSISIEEAAMIKILLCRMRQEGYHPERGGSDFSVILSREEKKKHLAGLR